MLTKTTTVLGTLFLVISLALALLSRGTGASSGVEAEGFRLNPEAAGTWVEEELNPPQAEPAGEEAAETEASGVTE